MIEDIPLKILILLASGALGVGFIGSLVQKIVWDWLKTRGGSTMVKTDTPIKEKTRCEEHIDVVNRVKACEVCNANLKKDQASLASRFEVHLSYIEKRFDQGDARMASMDESIKSIDLSITELVTIIKERAVTGKSLLQNSIGEKS